MPIARVVVSERVAAPREIGAHRLVALVHPRGEARDGGGRVRGLHCLQRVGALAGREVALEDRVVVDGALRLVGEDGGGDACAVRGPRGRRR